MQLIKEQSFTDRIFLEVLDHGFQPQKAPTTSQRRINCFHVSALTIFSTLHLCKCSCNIAQSKSNNICTLHRQTIFITKNCAFAFHLHLRFAAFIPNQVNWPQQTDRELKATSDLGHDGCGDSKILLRLPSEPIGISWFAVSLFVVSLSRSVVVDPFMQPHYFNSW